LSAFAPSIMAILSGHIHMDWWQVINAGNIELPMSGTPGISPLFGNNPAFKIYDYQGVPIRLVNYVTYYVPLTTAFTSWQQEYEFNSAYLHQGADLTTGMDELKQNGELADTYKRYYAVGRDAQPITTENKWLPFYWCAIHFYTTKRYSTCLTKPV
jgi:sphingomyelin phosphodiesterase acid-like 3